MTPSVFLLKFAMPPLMLVSAIGCDKPAAEIPPVAPAAISATVSPAESSTRAVPAAVVVKPTHVVTAATRKKKPATAAMATRKPSSSFVRVLETKNYLVTIDDDREEGDVTSDSVTYHCVSKVSGKRLTLKGATYHTWDRDGTPVRFLGYKFENGDTTYIVHESGELEVSQKSKTLVDETGAWRDNGI